jgi:hypothetical protein
LETKCTTAPVAGDGRTVVASSYDGTVAVFRIPESVLSAPVSDKVKNRIFKQVYGDSVGAGGRSSVFDEDATLVTSAALSARAAAAAGASGVLSSGYVTFLHFYLFFFFCYLSWKTTRINARLAHPTQTT